MSRYYSCKDPRGECTSKEEATLRKIFDLYSVTPGDCSPMRFINLHLLEKFLENLSAYSPILKDLDMELVKAFFALVDRDCDGKISYAEFTGWWRSEYTTRERYDIFRQETRPLLRSAWRLFQRFCIGKCIPYRRFEYMMDYLRVHYSDTDFDVIDLDSDGVLSFSEFCEWLKWF